MCICQSATSHLLARPKTRARKRRPTLLSNAGTKTLTQNYSQGRVYCAAITSRDVHSPKEGAMVGSNGRKWIVLPLLGLTLSLTPISDRTDAQQPSTANQNPYLKGTEGYGQGPRGLT